MLNTQRKGIVQSDVKREYRRKTPSIASKKKSRRKQNGEDATSPASLVTGKRSHLEEDSDVVHVILSQEYGLGTHYLMRFLLETFYF